MNRIWNNKQRLLPAAIAVCCIVALVGLVWAFCVQKTVQVGCTQEDLNWAPILETETKTEGETPQEKRVFLTFDDGPSETTELVLAALKEKNVPATFFVVAAENNEDYLPLIQQEVEQGHEIALHSCTHSYKKIYANSSAFWADIKDLREKISPYVDVDTIKYIRFPGGSTNTVSRKYGGSGIMKTLKNQVQEKGYTYVDWNVCADDAVGKMYSPHEIFNNVIEDVGDKSTCVVLMHDTKSTKNTAKALPEIIDWFTEQGYRFCVISELDRQI